MINYLAARTKKNSIDSTSTESATAVIKGATDSKTKKTKKEKEEDKKKKPTADKPNVNI